MGAATEYGGCALRGKCFGSVAGGRPERSRDHGPQDDAILVVGFDSFEALPPPHKEVAYNQSAPSQTTRMVIHQDMVLLYSWWITLLG